MPPRGRSNKSTAIFEFKAKDDVSKKSANIANALDRMASSARILEGPLGAIAGRLTSLAASIRKFGVAGTVFNVSAGKILTQISTGIKVFAVFEEQLNRLDRQMSFLGKTTTNTAASLDGFTQQVGEFTLASAKELNNVAGVIVSFEGAAEHLEEVLLFSQSIAENTGKSIATVARSISKALDDPKLGLDSLGRSYLKLTTHQREVIKGFNDMGQTSKSVAVIMEALNDKVAGQSSGQKPSLARSFDTLVEKTEQFNRRLGSVFAGLVRGTLDIGSSIVDFTTKAIFPLSKAERISSVSAKRFIETRTELNNQLRRIRDDDTLNEAQRVEKIFAINNKLERNTARRKRANIITGQVDAVKVQRDQEIANEEEALAKLEFLIKQHNKQQGKLSAERIKIAVEETKKLNLARKNIFSFLSKGQSDLSALAQERTADLITIQQAEEVNFKALDRIRQDELKSFEAFQIAKARINKIEAGPGGAIKEQRDDFNKAQEKFLLDQGRFNAKTESINASNKLINEARTRVELDFLDAQESLLNDRANIRGRSLKQTSLQQLAAKFIKEKKAKEDANASIAELRMLDREFNEEAIKITFKDQDKKAEAFFKKVRIGVDKVRSSIDSLQEGAISSRPEQRVEAIILAVKKGAQEIAQLTSKEVSIASLGGDQSQKNLAEGLAKQKAFIIKNFGEVEATKRQALLAIELLEKEFISRSLALDKTRSDKLVRKNEELADRFASPLDKVRKKQLELTNDILVKNVNNSRQFKIDITRLNKEISADVRSIISSLDGPTARLTDTRNIDVIETQTAAIIIQLKERLMASIEIAKQGQTDGDERRQLVLEAEERFQRASLAIATQGGRRIESINDKRLAGLNKLKDAETQQERFSRLNTVIKDLIASSDQATERAKLTNDVITQSFNSIVGGLKLIDVGGIKTQESLEALLNKRVEIARRTFSDEKLRAGLILKLQEDFTLNSEALENSRREKLSRQFKIFENQIGSDAERIAKQTKSLIESIGFGSESVEQFDGLMEQVGQDFIDQISKVGDLKINAILEFQDDDTFSEIGERVQAALAANKDITDSAKRFIDKEVADRRLGAKLKNDIDKEAADNTVKINTAAAEKVLAKWQQSLSGFAGLADNLAGIASINQEMATEKVERESKRREDAVKSEFDGSLQTLVDARNAGEITETEFANNRSMLKQQETASLISLEKQKTDALNKEARKAFEVNKKFELLSSTLKGGAAVISSFKAGADIGGPVTGFAFAAVAASFVAKQIQLLQSTTFSPNVSSTRPSPRPLRNASNERSSSEARSSSTTINVFGSDNTTFSRQQVESVMDSIENASDRGDRIIFNRRSRQKLELNN